MREDYFNLRLPTERKVQNLQGIVGCQLVTDNDP